MITVAWDIDDVLNNLTLEWLNNYNLSSTKKNIEFSSLTKNPPHTILNIKKEEYLASLDSFRGSRYIDLMPNTSVVNWFENFGSYAHNIVLTAVPYKYAPISSQWVFKHFGRWIRSFNFIPSFRSGEELPQFDKSKAAFIARMKNIDILVEDNEQNTTEAQKLGVKTFLVDRPWNSSKLKIENILEEIQSLIGK